MIDTLSVKKSNAGKHKKSIATKSLVYVGLIVYSVWLFFPFLIIVISSFTSDLEMMNSLDFVWLPKWSVEGYKLVFEFDPNKVFGIPSLLIGFFNTMWQTLLTVCVGLFMSGLAAYAYAKWDFPGKNKLFAVNLLFMTIPVSAGMSSYLFYSAIGWTSGNASVLPLIVPGLFGSAGVIFFMYPYIKAVPDGVVEAARIDGMSFFGIYVRIIFPLAKPVFLAQFLFGFVGNYNNYTNALIYLLGSKNLWTLQIALQQIVSYITKGGGYSNAQCAATLMSMAPLLLLYVFVQKYFIEGVTAGSVKG